MYEQKVLAQGFITIQILKWHQDSAEHYRLQIWMTSSLHRRYNDQHYSELVLIGH